MISKKKIMQKLFTQKNNAEGKRITRIKRVNKSMLLGENKNYACGLVPRGNEPFLWVWRCSEHTAVSVSQVTRTVVAEWSKHRAQIPLCALANTNIDDEQKRKKLVSMADAWHLYKRLKESRYRKNSKSQINFDILKFSVKQQTSVQSSGD